MRKRLVAVKWLCLLTALMPVPSFSSYGQAQILPIWVVMDSEDLKGGLLYNAAAADALSEELAKTGLYNVVPCANVRQRIKGLGERINESNFILHYWLAREFKANVVVMSALVDYRIRKGNGKERAAVVLYVVAKDADSFLPVSGALAKSESAVLDAGAPDQEAVADALRQAASLAVEHMRSQSTPKASIVSLEPKKAFIDRGTREGFKKGDLVQIARGAINIGTAHVRVVGPEKAEIVFVRMGERPSSETRSKRYSNPHPCRIRRGFSSSAALVGSREGSGRTPLCVSA